MSTLFCVLLTPLARPLEFSSVYYIPARVRRTLIPVANGPGPTLAVDLKCPPHVHPGIEQRSGLEATATSLEPLGPRRNVLRCAEWK